MGVRNRNMEEEVVRVIGVAREKKHTKLTDMFYISDHEGCAHGG